MRSREDLIIDVGMNDGEDTAYYLHKGFSVVAIDANPVMIELAGKRFQDAIESGRLTLLNVGITEQFEKSSFYISERFSEWSSFDISNATKGGSSAREIHVDCIPFAKVIEDFGIPHYLKIDIEGNDRLCLDALQPGDLPDFISLEMSHASGDEDIRKLAAVGYDRFKCIRQNDFKNITPANVGSETSYRRLASKTGFISKVLRSIRAWRKKLSTARDGDWVFQFGSSGMFGADLPGSWLSADEVLGVWKALHDIDQELSAGKFGEWFDIHATTSQD